MLLETLDLRTNDILIYSQNLFNFNENFKIIYKNAKVKKTESVSYFDVCNFVKDPSPKNLILYRLLTNVNSLDAYSTKYGYFVNINDKMELVYFDPIYAIKDLRHLRFEFDPGNFRFKIQQVGLTSLTRWEDEPHYREVYSFDLKAAEAQNQNDKIFADAIFAFDPNFQDQDDERRGSLKEIINRNSNGNIQKDIDTSDLSKMKIAEDRSVPKESLKQPVAQGSSQASEIREEVISLLKQALNIPEQGSNYVPLSKGTAFEEDNESKIETVSLLDLFKSTNKSENSSLNEKESVALRFERK
jgi:hypothetical protein